MNTEELQKILTDHKNWLNGEKGKKADLKGANLIGADLKGANLWEANHKGANLKGANLREANLKGANLWEANLKGANLWEANLKGANLWEANLWGANLTNIKTNYLTTGFSLSCPKEGSFIAWKKVRGKLVKLLIPEDAERSSATTNKCRCSKAKVLWIEGDLMSIKSSGNYGPVVDYRVQEIVEPDSWDPDRWNECSHGIHFFMNREHAESWD